MTRYNSKAREFEKSHAPDFKAVVEQARDAVQDLVQELGPTALNIIDGYTTIDAEHGPAIVYHLAQHPDEMERMAKLHPRQQLAALAKLDARLGGAPKAEARRAPARAPRVTVEDTSRGVTIEDASVDGESYESYKTRRNAEESARRR